MKKLKYVIAILIMLGGLSAARAQRGDLKLGLNYNYSSPLDGFKNDIINDASPRGMSGDLMYSINKKWSVGLQFGYQDYYQKYPRTVYNLDKNDQVSAVLSNSVQTVPFLFKGMYSPLGAKAAVQPYLAAAAGVNFITFNQYLGEFGNYDNSINFMAQGDLGVLIPFTRKNSVGLKMGASYNYVPYNRNGYTDLNSWDLHAGFYVSLH